MSRFVSNAGHVAGHALRILRTAPRGERNLLLREFLRVKSRELFPRRRGERQRERLLDFDIELLDYGHFVDMVEEIFVQQVYDVALPERPRILDCGSNIGISVMFFKSRYPCARVVAFEPHPAKAAVLLRNVERNALDGVEVVAKAVTGTTGTVDLQIDPDDPGSLVSGTRRRQATIVSVDATPLSPYLTEPVELIKLDVEGEELPVLEELAESGALAKVSQLVIEVHHHLDPAEEVLGRVFSLLEAAGFSLQVRGLPTIPFIRDELQDVLVYAYRRGTREDRLGRSLHEGSRILPGQLADVGLQAPRTRDTPPGSAAAASIVGALPSIQEGVLGMVAATADR